MPRSLPIRPPPSRGRFEGRLKGNGLQVDYSCQRYLAPAAVPSHRLNGRAPCFLHLLTTPP